MYIWVQTDTQDMLMQNDILLAILTILIVAGTITAAFFIARNYLRDRRRYIEEKEIDMDGVLSKSAMGSLVASYIFRTGRDTPFSLIYIDIDHFSEYNNAFGQKEGDKILDRFSANLRAALPKGAKLGRYQGDQFVAFIGTEHTKSQTIDFANQLKEVAKRPVKVYGDTEIKMTASIGIAFYPLHGRNFKELINSLRIAVYIVKKNGGDAIKLYSEDMEEREGQYVDYYYQIKSAIKNKQFQLYYQPMVNYTQQTLFGFEALIRWNHPEFGVLSPFKFINIMEQSGDIHWIGQWGLETLIKTYQQTKQQFPTIDLAFSINLSPKQMMNEDLPLEFKKLMTRYGMDPKKIILEVIEFALFEKQDTIFNNMQKLRQIGFRIAIDGLGMDYGTLSKLDQLPIDFIKLENDFLTEEEDFVKAKFADMLVEFAQRNKLTIIAEKIENEAMAKLATEHKIDIMQGFYFEKPMAIEALDDYLKEASWKKDEKK
ncbi:MAG: bifunctional diguanylate cyclase/phosphodiesterase [Acholeplasmatales bacterium]|nr:MAG: bifunctional diguanylate cyclase/phosphodiesterase [Acholeplasmatales bacterium]